MNFLPRFTCWASVLLFFSHEAAVAHPEEIRVGIIGLDTSHAIAFTTLFNADNPSVEMAHCRVVAAYPPGSPDIQSSVERVPKYTAQVKEMGVEIVDSIDELLSRVDAVLLETNDGRPHLEQALPVLRAKKRLFIDKPMASSLADVIAIFEAARKFETPVFSCSSLRYGARTSAVKGGSIGDVLGCDIWSPCPVERSHPDLFWYGIHGVEALFTMMGTGCETVARAHSENSDVVVGRWGAGRIGSYRGMRTGMPDYGGMAFGTTGNAPVGDYHGYEPLAVEIVRFFRGGPPPVTETETIEIIAFMEAAERSKNLGGQPVNLDEVIKNARTAARKRLATK